jgi:hypothetical protein
MARFNFASLLGGGTTEPEVELESPPIESEDATAPTKQEIAAERGADPFEAERNAAVDDEDDEDDEDEDEDDDEDYMSAYVEGLNDERARWVKVLTDENASKRAKLAFHLLSVTDLRCDRIVEVISAMPEEGDGGSALDRAMKAHGNPTIGTGAAASEESNRESKAAWARQIDKLNARLR